VSLITTSQLRWDVVKNRIGYPSRVFKEHINTDRIVLQPKTWRPDVIEVCPIFYYSHLIMIKKVPKSHCLIINFHASYDKHSLLPGRRCKSPKITSKIGLGHLLEYP
jgi:hypothetical protein